AATGRVAVVRAAAIGRVDRVGEPVDRRRKDCWVRARWAQARAEARAQARAEEVEARPRPERVKRRLGSRPPAAPPARAMRLSPRAAPPGVERAGQACCPSRTLLSSVTAPARKRPVRSIQIILAASS